jgi:hypothetical protein
VLDLTFAKMTLKGRIGCLSEEMSRIQLPGLDALWYGAPRVWRSLWDIF